jgi:tRNA/rRNA methyltransferase
VLRSQEAVALSSGAYDILSTARIVSNIDQALEDCNFAAALSTRPRKFPLPSTTPRAWATQLVRRPALKAAVIFGSERYGLPNKIVEKCNIMLSIPANPSYSSLNLAQAVQILAYECRIAADLNPELNPLIENKDNIANLEDVNSMLLHLEKALVEINFLDPLDPRKLVPRLRRFFSRAQLRNEEINIVRGIARNILEKNK